MIYTQLTKERFIDAMQNIRKNQLSYDALSAIYEYMEDVSEDANIEFDPIEIFCTYTEYENEEEALKDLKYENIDEMESFNFILRTDNNTIVLVA